jgi:hypothetical protein
MARPKKIKQFDIPNDILDRVNECCSNGFFLFTYDNTQTFRVYNTFDDDVSFKALKADILKYLQTIEMIESQQVLQSLLGGK